VADGSFKGGGVHQILGAENGVACAVELGAAFGNAVSCGERVKFLEGVVNVHHLFQTFAHQLAEVIFNALCLMSMALLLASGRYPIYECPHMNIRRVWCWQESFWDEHRQFSAKVHIPV